MANKKVLIFVGDEYEDLELQYPKYRMLEAGFEVHIAGPQAKESYKGHKGYPCVADLSFNEVNVANYGALIIPGGYAPDKLRKIPKVLEIVKEFNHQQKLIAFICHAGWIPISAGIVKGLKCTSVINIKDDLVNAGAQWVDEPVVVDRHFVSSRFPDDLPKFAAAIVSKLGSH